VYDRASQACTTVESTTTAATGSHGTRRRRPGADGVTPSG